MKVTFWMSRQDSESWSSVGGERVQEKHLPNEFHTLSFGNRLEIKKFGIK